jgi:hypothetical protein
MKKSLLIVISCLIVLSGCCWQRKKVIECPACEIVSEKITPAQETDRALDSQEASFAENDAAEADSGPISSPAEEEEEAKEIVLDDHADESQEDTKAEEDIEK